VAMAGAGATGAASAIVASYFAYLIGVIAGGLYHGVLFRAKAL
jgi:hypothetical protein